MQMKAVSTEECRANQILILQRSCLVNASKSTRRDNSSKFIQLSSATGAAATPHQSSAHMHETMALPATWQCWAALHAEPTPQPSSATAAPAALLTVLVQEDEIAGLVETGGDSRALAAPGASQVLVLSLELVQAW